ncbi:aldolase [Azospirillum sp. TSO35-2]|nr:aldolase [Azospirillum sp. TSO35-2]
MPLRFRKRLLDRERLVGSFVKTPTGHATEILGDVGFDFVIIDQEHAPFDRSTTDNVLLAARAAATAALVRVPRADPADILAALDDGAAGVLLPHIATVAAARDAVAACRYSGKRGFSNSPRAGRYGGLGLADHVAAGDASTTVIAMIEDPEALDQIDAILAVEGLDAVFIGRGDLTVAYRETSTDAPPVRQAVERITAAARTAGKPALAMVGRADAPEAGWLARLGVTGFVVASDQSFMRQAAGNALDILRRLEPSA